jgi:hypothetical protein
VQSIQLYIQGQRVDMFKDESVSITQSIKNVKDVAKIFTEFTKTFTLPASKANNKIFKHYYNFDITGGFDARTKKSATIELNYLPFKKGKIKLDGVELKNRKPYAYKVTFFGNTVDLKDVLGEDKLNALSSLNLYNQKFSADDIERGLKRNAATYSTGTVDSISVLSITDSSGFGSVSAGDLIINTTTNETTYIISYPTSTVLVLNEQIFTAGQTYEVNNHVLTPLITHTKRLYFDSGDNNQNTGNLYYASGNKHGVAWNELKYALRIHEIVKAIQSEYGFTFSNDFFNTTNDTYYDLYMWLHRKKGVVGFGGQVETFSRQITGWADATGSNVDMEDDTLKIDLPDSYIDDLDLTLYRTGTTPYDVIVKKDGISVYEETGITATTKNINLPREGGHYTVFIEYAATITFDTSPYVRWTVDVALPDEPIVTDTFDLTSAFTAPADIEFIITEQMPEMKVIDFLTGLFKMFNLTAYVQDNGTIKIQTLDDFYATSNTYDISQYVDVNSSQVDVALPYREVSFKYEDTDTFLAATHNQIFNQEWAKEDYTQVDENDNIVDGSLYDVVAPFGHLKFERLINIDDSSSTSIQWGWSADDNQEAYIGKPILFYPVHNLINGTYSDLSYVTEINADGSYHNHTSISGSISMPSNSVSFSSGTSTANINFKLERNEYTGDSSFTGTLFENYYKTYIEDVFNIKTRLTKVKAYLPMKILLNFTLADRFDINGQRYKINSIETNLATGESNIELLNEV